MDKNAWLIWHGIDDGCPAHGLTFICLDKTDALETFMTLVEEELEETFFWMTQDTHEDANQNWEERAQWLNLYDAMWYVMEVPVIYGDSCSEELSKPARGQRALLGVW